MCWSHLAHPDRCRHKSDRPLHRGLRPLLISSNLLISNNFTGSFTSSSNWRGSSHIKQVSATLSRSVNRYSNRSGSKCVGPTETELNIQKCGLGFNTSTKFDVWERLALVLRRCLSYSGFASLEKSLNFRGNPWILFFLEKSLNFLQLWMWWPGKSFWCFLVVQAE